MILSDTSLDTLAQNGLVHPYNSNHLSPCSIDLTLSNKILVESCDDKNGPWCSVNIDGGYQIAPKQFFLASTEEIITIPNDCCGQIVLRSSAARAGLDHCLAGFIDAGWHGRITLEFTNQLQLSQFNVHTGQRLVQLLVHKLNQPVKTSYAIKGNYQNQYDVTPSNLNFNSIS